MAERICSVPDCENPVGRKSARGLCHKHYRRWRLYGDPLATKYVSLEERFWRQVDKSGGADACWPWLLSTNKKGYGKFGLSDQTIVGAHRMAYQLTHGPVPDGLLVCHHCDNPPCCNPAHLYAGTYSDNGQDMMARGRGRGQFQKGRRSRYWPRRSE